MMNHNNPFASPPLVCSKLKRLHRFYYTVLVMPVQGHYRNRTQLYAKSALFHICWRGCVQVHRRYICLPSLWTSRRSVIKKRFVLLLIQIFFRQLIYIDLCFRQRRIFFHTECEQRRTGQYGRKAYPFQHL